MKKYMKGLEEEQLEQQKNRGHKEKKSN